VAKRFTPASTGCATLLIVGGGVTLLFALALFGSSGDQGASVVMLLFAMGVIAGGIVWLRSLKPTFHVFLASASAERQSLSSQDEALIDRVTSAISDAIIYRG
jgi:hypothetical protein